MFFFPLLNTNASFWEYTENNTLRGTTDKDNLPPSVRYWCAAIHFLSYEILDKKMNYALIEYFKRFAVAYSSVIFLSDPPSVTQ
jgi:hypothetical protein